MSEASETKNKKRKDIPSLALVNNGKHHRCIRRSGINLRNCRWATSICWMKIDSHFERPLHKKIFLKRLGKSLHTIYRTFRQAQCYTFGESLTRGPAEGRVFFLPHEMMPIRIRLSFELIDFKTKFTLASGQCASCSVGFNTSTLFAFQQKPTSSHPIR